MLTFALKQNLAVEMKGRHLVLTGRHINRKLAFKDEFGEPVVMTEKEFYLAYEKKDILVREEQPLLGRVPCVRNAPPDLSCWPKAHAEEALRRASYLDELLQEGEGILPGNGRLIGLIQLIAKRRNDAKPPSPSAMSTLACERCHTSLSKVNAVQQPAQAGALKVALELETRLLKLRKRRRAAGSQLSLIEFHEMALRLGIRGCPTSRTKPMKPANIGALSIAGPIAEQAGQALRNWPRGFMRLLDSVRRDRNCERSWRIARAMGPIYKDIYKSLPNPQFDFIRTAFEAYVRDRWQAPVALRNRNLSQELIENHRWISREEAAHALGIETPLVDYLVDSGQMQCREHIHSSGRRARVVDANIPERLLERLRGSVTLEQAAELLGIGKTRTRQLAAAGVLKTFGGTPRQGSRWWLDRVSLEQLCATPRLSTPPEAPVSPVAQIARHLAMTDIEFSEMTRAVSEGSLRVFSPDSALAPFGAWLVENREIRAWRAHRNHLHAGMSVTQAAQALGVKQEVAYALVRLGLLRAEVALDVNRRSQTIPVASLKSFRSRYVFGPELAVLLNADPRSLSKKLKSHGFKPVAGPTLPGALCRQYVWQRKVIAKLQRH
jgi:hypothetical protein